MPDETPRSSARTRSAIEDFIVSEMRSGFGDLHRRLDGYTKEAAQNNADLKAHITNCDRRYGEMLAARGAETTTAIYRRKRSFPEWAWEKIKESAFNYALVVVLGLVYFALTHGGAHLLNPG